MKKQFPNGFASWQETHYEVVSEIKTQLMLYFEHDLSGHPDRDRTWHNAQYRAETITQNK